MNKGQGLATGALFLGAALLRPGGLSPQASDIKPPSSHMVDAAAQADTTDGPWAASCNYWKPAGAADSRGAPPSQEATKADLAITGNSADLNMKLHVSEPAASPDCGAEKWGIPQGSEDTPAIITAIIATVPDPIHSSMALDFDRAMDVITMAAADNSYLMSYYWLPWTRPSDSHSSQAGGADAQRDAQTREKQPGLLILRPRSSMQATIDAPPPHLVYLFLVAQTPALGINGDQMRNALRYENELHTRGVADLSVRDPKGGADIIGPDYTGSADSLRAALLSAPDTSVSTFHVIGTTSTGEAASTLATPPTHPGANNRVQKASTSIDYVSFGEDSALEQRNIRSIYGQSHLAFLFETGTAYGSSLSKSSNFDRFAYLKKDRDEPLIINFPREISLLRNAQKEDKTPTDAAAAVAAATPYLHLSLKNSGTEDTIAHLSPELTPFSQESQWMSIVRELKEGHAETVAVSASNILDELFLAQSLHRDLPDARVILFDASDLLFARSGDNAPYLGSLSATAYPLLDLEPSLVSRHLHDFASTQGQSIYNAVSYTLWNGDNAQPLSLSGYDKVGSSVLRPPPLWMTTVGRDGYYPLSIVSPCSSENPHILPVIALPEKPAQAGHPVLPQTIVCKDDRQDPDQSVREVYSPDRQRYPAFSWYLLCLVVTLFCLAHTLVLHTASFWSPVTRDLAIEHSDEPRRRSVYVHIATSMLLSMSVITMLPALTTHSLLHGRFYTAANLAAVLTLLSGVLAAFSTVRRTLPYIRRPSPEPPRTQSSCGGELAAEERENLVSEASLYTCFHLIALLAAVAISGLWVYLCLNNTAADGSQASVGLFFGYRCLHPASGVSPLLPILILLASWYIWALLQTKRLRFSENSRPMLPRKRDLGTTSPLYVSDDALSRCSRPIDSCLYDNVTCLLITRQLVRRTLPKPSSGINVVLSLIYLGLFIAFVFGLPIQSLDRFLRLRHLGLTPYEFLISALFYPLLVIALTGCVRMLTIWTSLRGGLLEPLERSPLRFSFSRLTDVDWMTMLRQSGLHEYWRDMTRSNEAMEQMFHNGDLCDAATAQAPELWHEASQARKALRSDIKELRDLIEATSPTHRRGSDKPQPEPSHRRDNVLCGIDLPKRRDRAELNLMRAIECDYAAFAEALLAGVLVPFWTSVRALPVEAEPAVAAAVVPLHIQLAEEFLAIRYLSLIRAVLINLRLLMTFVSTAFVFALLAWNCYPFEPRQWIDWAFTGLLVSLGSAIIWVFAQMHRNPILSRITGTRANELGGAFYLRLATFGAVPVLTWLASQFPAIGSGVNSLLQSGLQLAK